MGDSDLEVVVDTLEFRLFIGIDNGIQGVLEHFNFFYDVPAEPVDLFLQFLDPLHLIVDIALLVEFIGYEIAKLILIVISESEDLLEVCPLVVVDDVLLLVLHDRLPYFRDVFEQHFSLQDREELGVVIHDVLPVRLSNRVALALGVGLVDEDLALVEANVERTDDSVCSQAQFELLSLVHFVANVVLSKLDE